VKQREEINILVHKESVLYVAAKQIGIVLTAGTGAATMFRCRTGPNIFMMSIDTVV
jgi:hypothetical protein